MDKENVNTPAEQTTGTGKDSVKTSAAQKSAQKKYDEKTKMLSIKYTPVDMADYEKLRAHLEENGLSANQFIKGLIHDFFDPAGKTVPAPETALDAGAGSGTAAKPGNETVKAQAAAGSGRSAVPEWFD